MKVTHMRIIGGSSSLIPLSKQKCKVSNGFLLRATTSNQSEKILWEECSRELWSDENREGKKSDIYYDGVVHCPNQKVSKDWWNSLPESV